MKAPSCIGPSFSTNLPPAGGDTSQYPGVLNEEGRCRAMDSAAASKEVGVMLSTVAGCQAGPSSDLIAGGWHLGQLKIGGERVWCRKEPRELS